MVDVGMREPPFCAQTASADRRTDPSQVGSKRSYGWAGKPRARRTPSLARIVVDDVAMAPPLGECHQLLRELAQFGRAEFQPALGREGGVVPLPGRLGVREPFLSSLELPLQASDSAARAAVTAPTSVANSARDQRVLGATSRHQRSRRSRASSGASTTSPASASTLRWWLALPTA
jgi:hypothetical protein